MVTAVFDPVQQQWYPDYSDEVEEETVELAPRLTFVDALEELDDHSRTLPFTVGNMVKLWEELERIEAEYGQKDEEDGCAGMEGFVELLWFDLVDANV